jgi:hypothetical protein
MTAARKLAPLEHDPVLAAFDNAPLGEPFTDDERAAFEVGMEDIRTGRVRSVSRDDMRATLERMRREQGE